METETIKTMDGWKQSKLNLTQYLQPGDPIDEDIFDYALCVLPPETYISGKALQIGEPYSSNEHGATWITFEKINGVWVYTGIKNKIQ